MKDYLDKSGLSHLVGKLKENFASNTHTHSEFNIDYDELLAFDTSEIVFDANTSPVLGRAILGQMILV